MKIIRHPKAISPKAIGRWAHATAVNVAISAEEAPGTRKKALLVGITYGGKSNGGLVGPHTDVEVMKDLLIKQYSYHPQNIVTMKDEDGMAKHLVPTRDNMLREIAKLVKDVCKGDRLFFHFSGHSIQTPNNSYSEEDGMDECLVPSDGPAIKDNELKRHLVDVLPVGCQLTTVFDSCHSESLLDLPHNKCNRVYVPWVSKGQRRSQTLRSIISRRPALPMDVTLPDLEVINRRTVYQKRRINSHDFVTRKTSIDAVRSKSANITSVMISSRTRSLSLRPKFKTMDHMAASGPPTKLTLSTDTGTPPPNTPNTSESFGLAPWVDGETCDSPIQLFPCDGFCRVEHTHEPQAMANVISLSSCKDAQITWEDGEGKSMTVALVNILKKTPHPTLTDLLTILSHNIYQSCTKIHTKNTNYRRNLNAWLQRHKDNWLKGPRRKRGEPNIVHGLDTNNFQDPQLASLRPLDMSRTFNP